MMSERELFKKLSVAANVKMPPDKQPSIWESIEQRMDNTRSFKRLRRPVRILGFGAAAAVLVAVVGGGVYLFSNPGGPSGAAIPQYTTGGSAPAPAPAFAIPTAIQTISMSSDTPARMILPAKDPNSAEQNVLTWLRSATPYAGKVPESANVGTLHGYMGPAQLNMVSTDGQAISIAPASYLTKAAGGQIQVQYVQDVIVYSFGSEKMYLHAPELFAWLKNDEWKTEFGMH